MCAEGVGEFQPRVASTLGKHGSWKLNAESVRPGLTLSGLHEILFCSPGLSLRSNRWAGISQRLRRISQHLRRISQRLRRISSGFKLTHHFRFGVVGLLGRVSEEKVCDCVRDGKAGSSFEPEEFAARVEFKKNVPVVR